MRNPLLLLLTIALWSVPLASPAQSPDERPIALTLDAAIEIALAGNYAVRTTALEAASAQAQVREAWGQVKPTVSVSSSYTRNVITANPFAGSEAGGIFGALGAIDWLAYNERARTDGDPGTEPLSLDEFRNRQMDGLAQAGVSLDPGRNPFGVPNQFQAGVSINQTIYSGAAFAAIRGARGLREIHEAALVQQKHQVVHQTRRLFYGALLAQQQAQVARAAVGRAQETQGETARLVAAGTLPVLERLSAEVEVTNLETQYLNLENEAANARAQLLHTLGLPVDAPVRLQGSLDVSPDRAEFVAAQDAIAAALERRPEVVQARLAIHLEQVNRNITRAQARPVLSAFANLSYLGNVPDDRTLIMQGVEPDDPFAVSLERRGFFDSGYWNPTVAVGAQLSWNLFDGQQTRYRVQQDQLAVEQAQVQLEQTEQLVMLEVDQALRSLASARQRIVAQSENVARAETAYEFASTRLSTGVASQLDVRMASVQLDQARLGYLQAAYDFLVARSELQRATGLIVPAEIREDEPILTTAAERRLQASTPPNHD